MKHLAKVFLMVGLIFTPLVSYAEGNNGPFGLEEFKHAEAFIENGMPLEGDNNKCETDEAGNAAFSWTLYSTRGHQIGYSCWYMTSVEPFADGSGLMFNMSRVEFHTNDGILVIKGNENEIQNEARFSSLPSVLGEDPIPSGDKEPIMNAFEWDIDGESTGFYQHFVGGKINYRSKHTLVNTGNGFAPGYCHRCIAVIFV